MTVGHFLGGVAALVWDEDTQRYLLLRRAAARDFGGGAWECVTGRVEQGESYTQALHREVQEEIGVAVQVEFILATTHFYRGSTQAENELLGVIYACTLCDPVEQVRISGEHSQMRWLSAAEALAELPPEHWLSQVIRRAERLRARLPTDLRREFQEQGFEI